MEEEAVGVGEVGGQCPSPSCRNGEKVRRDASAAVGGIHYHKILSTTSDESDAVSGQVFEHTSQAKETDSSSTLQRKTQTEK